MRVQLPSLGAISVVIRGVSVVLLSAQATIAMRVWMYVRMGMNVSMEYVRSGDVVLSGLEKFVVMMISVRMVVTVSMISVV